MISFWRSSVKTSGLLHVQPKRFRESCAAFNGPRQKAHPFAKFAFAILQMRASSPMFRFGLAWPVPALHTSSARMRAGAADTFQEGSPCSRSLADLEAERRHRVKKGEPVSLNSPELAVSHSMDLRSEICRWGLACGNHAMNAPSILPKLSPFGFDAFQPLPRLHRPLGKDTDFTN